MQEKLEALVGRWVDVYSLNSSMLISGELYKDGDLWEVHISNGRAMFTTDEVHSVGGECGENSITLR